MLYTLYINELRERGTQRLNAVVSRKERENANRSKTFRCLELRRWRRHSRTRWGTSLPGRQRVPYFLYRHSLTFSSFRYFFGRRRSFVLRLCRSRVCQRFPNQKLFGRNRAPQKSGALSLHVWPVEGVEGLSVNHFTALLEITRATSATPAAIAAIKPQGVPNLSHQYRKACAALAAARWKAQRSRQVQPVGLKSTSRTTICNALAANGRGLHSSTS